MLGDYNEDTETDLEDNTVHDTEEVKKKTNTHITAVIAEYHQDDEVLDENIYFDGAKDPKT